VYFIREVSVDLLERFIVRGLPGLADTSKATAVAKLRCFLRDGFRRGWITQPLAEQIRPHKAVYEQKEPYTEEEVDLILAEALKWNGGTHGYAKHPETFRLLLDLMLETGMRVGDAIRFKPASLSKGKGKHLWNYSYVPQKSRKAETPRFQEAYLSDRSSEQSKPASGCPQRCHLAMALAGTRLILPMRCRTDADFG
jgi:integrase